MVRLVDIAKKTGFSVNTVSHVVNGKNDVKEETRRIIEKCIEEMGYVKNVSAQNLRTGKSGLIALIIDDFLNPRCSVLADEMAVYCHERGYTLCIFSTNGDEKKERACVTRAAECRVDGVIMMPVSSGY